MRRVCVLVDIGHLAVEIFRNTFLVRARYLE